MKKKSLLVFTSLLVSMACLADEKPQTPTSPSTIESVIAFLPLGLVFLILLITTIKLQRDGTKLSDLITEKSTLPVAQAGQEGQAGQPPQSVSRFIAFLSGLTALIFSACFCTFFIYSYFKNPEKPVDLSNLSTVLWGLGIGLVPYGFNKTSAALQPKP